jgi:hypothetical protein
VQYLFWEGREKEKKKKVDRKVKIGTIEKKIKKNERIYSRISLYHIFVGKK